MSNSYGNTRQLLKTLSFTKKKEAAKFIAGDQHHVGVLPLGEERLSLKGKNISILTN